MGEEKVLDRQDALDHFWKYIEPNSEYEIKGVRIDKSSTSVIRTSAYDDKVIKENSHGITINLQLVRKKNEQPAS